MIKPCRRGVVISKDYLMGRLETLKEELEFFKQTNKYVDWRDYDLIRMRIKDLIIEIKSLEIEE